MLGLSRSLPPTDPRKNTMHKLKLESLAVESFETAQAAAPRARGTVAAHGKPGGPGPLNTYSIEQCGDTMYFDCTLGCSINTQCAGACGLSEFNCLVTFDLNCA